MAKNWEDMSPLEKDKYSKQYADIYGVNRDDYQEEDTGSQGAFDQKGYEEAISSCLLYTSDAADE